MGRFSPLMLALLLGAASAVALASCGGGSDAKLLPGTTAKQIESNLDQVQTLVNSGDCVGAEDAVAQVSSEVEELHDVAAKLKTALQEGTGRLSEVVGRCEEESAEETEQAAEADVEAEEELEQEAFEAEGEKAEKAQEKAEKQEQKVEEKAEAAEEVEEGNLPPQSEGKGKAKGHEEAVPPPVVEPTPEEAESGGVGPGVGVE
jgi:hypothetical protein